MTPAEEPEWICVRIAVRRADPHPYLADPARPRILAHRGFVPPDATARAGAAPAAAGSASFAENTHAAFLAAQHAGARYLESDGHLTRDGRVVLAHDSDLSRVAGDPRRIADVTHRELAAIMADRGGLLTLSEALEAFPEACFNLDVKAAGVAEPMGRAVAHHAHRVLLTSFSDRWRRTALRAAARVPGTERPATSPGRGALVRILAAVALGGGTGSRPILARAFAGLDALQVPERQGAIRVLTPRLLAAAHRHGVEVHVWTVNDPARMRALVDLGVDGIVTDRTDLAVAEFGRPR